MTEVRKYRSRIVRERCEFEEQEQNRDENFRARHRGKRGTGRDAERDTETDTEEGSGGTRRGAKPRWKSWFGSPTAVMDANPRTKRIKDLQEQIHAREFGLGDGKGAKKNGREEGRRGEEGGRSSVPNGFK